MSLTQLMMESTEERSAREKEEAILAIEMMRAPSNRCLLCGGVEEHDWNCQNNF